MEWSSKTRAASSNPTGILPMNRFLEFFCFLFGSKGSGSIGRAPVSKTGGWGFKSLLPCQLVLDYSIKARNHYQANNLI